MLFWFVLTEPRALTAQRQFLVAKSKRIMHTSLVHPSLMLLTRPPGFCFYIRPAGPQYCSETRRSWFACMHNVTKFTRPRMLPPPPFPCTPTRPEPYSLIRVERGHVSLEERCTPGFDEEDLSNCWQLPDDMIPGDGEECELNPDYGNLYVELVVPAWRWCC